MDQDTLDSVMESYGEFQEYYAICVAYVGKIPDQLNNEIRSAFSHLYRCWKAQNISSQRDEAHLAKRHIERASRDSLKIVIDALSKESKAAVQVIQKRSLPSSDVFDRHMKLRDAYRDIAAREATDPSAAVSTEMRQHLQDIIDFNNYCSTYAEVEKFQFWLFRYRLKKIAYTCLSVFSVGLIGLAIEWWAAPLGELLGLLSENH